MSAIQFTDMGVDETIQECIERVEKSNRYALKPSPEPQDEHVRAFEIFMWNWIETLAWKKRQERNQFD